MKIIVANSEQETQQTSFSNISKISAGWSHSLFQNNKGEIFACGYNEQVHCELGRFTSSQVTQVIPRIINTLKKIQQISYGSCGQHFLAKNSQNQIFATGNNDFGQLGTGDTQSVSILKEMNSQYSTIWRDNIFYSRAKSARK